MTTTGVRVNLNALGTESRHVPVKVEILDKSFNLVRQDWQNASSSTDYALEPGMYGIRASASSGHVFEQMVLVEQGEMANCAVPIHQVSPHESHEWAYLTRPLNEPGQESLESPRYAGLWLRFWHKQRGGPWRVVPPPNFDAGQIGRETDGVTYQIRAERSGLFAIQVGGSRVPWKFVALPSSYEVMVLIRPSSRPATDEHPLDVVVSSDDFEMESLLAFLRRGDMVMAESLVNPAEYAERLLYSKMQNTAAAAVGGYFLLRVNDLERLHNWANNLANWFEWMADGPIIHAWQILGEVRSKPEKDQAALDSARDRLLEAVERGIPVYTEGLRLLRDGLLLFDRSAKGEDEAIPAALQKIGRYSAAADWSSTTTSFIGEEPEEPEAEAGLGQPDPGPESIYVFDVPLARAVERGLLVPGAEIYSDTGSTRETATVKEDGSLLYKGQAYDNLSALQTAVTGQYQWAWWSWALAANGDSLFSVVDPLRYQPR